MSHFEVEVCKERFKFNCAHFIAYKGFRERLHGHNYNVSVTLRGKALGERSRGEDGYLIDFGEVKEHTVKICKAWNERFIVPMRSDVLQTNIDDETVEILCEDGTKFVMPKGDCLLLPIVHSSAEEIAEHFCALLVDALGNQRLQERGIHSIVTGVAEAPGQTAYFHFPLDNEQGVKSHGENGAELRKYPSGTPKPCFFGQ